MNEELNAIPEVKAEKAAIEKRARDAAAELAREQDWKESVEKKLADVNI